ncbi:MAG: component of SufBCD complex [Pararhodobacter sp.]|nr:component of SufBCD complex [Pararhodobacter sp.]
MNWYDNVFSMIDLRSFTNLWYWIALAVTWSSLSHYVIGVPFDMVQRARRNGGQAMVDLEALVDIQTRRQLYILRTGGVWVIGFWSAFISALAVIGFGYRVELAQALTLLFLPMSLVFVLGFRLAARLEAETPRDEALTRRLTWHRFKVQLIGMFSILITALWGMWQFHSIGVLGR